MSEKEINLKPIFPNAVTMSALAFGVSSINMAFWGQWELAIIFIGLACVFDFLDGKVARLLNVSSKFGAELDSLSDFVSFGVAPAFIMYLWTLNEQTKISVFQNLAGKSDAVGVYWVFVLFVSMCCASRLARFNSLLDVEQPRYWLHFFMGVPAPAGGFITIMPLIFWIATGQTIDFFKNPIFVASFLLLSGILMASKIPTLSLKHLKIPSQMTSLLSIIALFTIAALITFPWVMLSIIGIAYLCSVPVCVYYFLKFKKQG